MQDNKDITPYKNGIPHGYWETYWDKTNLWYKCFYVNSTLYGYSLLYGPEINVNKIMQYKKTYYAK